jgi:hypothetical protein
MEERVKFEKLSVRATILLALAGIVFQAGVLGVGRSVPPVDNEFANLYAGAHLPGTDRVYDPAAIKTVLDRWGSVIPARYYYCRLPYFVLITWPLSLLSFPAGFLGWKIVQAICVGIWAWCWLGSRRRNFVLACWFLPVAFAVGLAQDVTLLMAVIAASAALERRGRSFWAGAVFALCMSKPHLFVFVPVAMAALKNWRFFAGAAAGGAALLGISFASAGATWPAKFLAVIRNPGMHPYVANMPGLRRLLDVPGGVLLFALAAVLVGWCVWRAARQARFADALAVALCGGLLINTHSYSVDCVLLLPLLTTMTESGVGVVRALATALALPFVYIGLGLGISLPYQLLGGCLLALAGTPGALGRVARYPISGTLPRASGVILVEPEQT